MKLFIIYTTYEFCGLPLAMKLQREGNKVIMAVVEPEMEEDTYRKPKNKKEWEVYNGKIESFKKTGEGMVTKEWAGKITKRLLSKQDEYKENAYIIFDYIAGFKYGEQLRQAGFKVLGGSKMGYKLETNRDETLKLLKSMGFDMPKRVQFSKGQADKGIQYLKDNVDELYAFKSDNTDVSTMVAENSNEELIDKIQAEKADINKEPFILQEKVEGVEGNIETWYSNGKPIMANVDIEVKKKFNDISPVQTGCAYDLVFAVPLESELRKMANKPMDAFMAKYIPTGRMDLAFIYSASRKKMYALEVCGDRPGYNQIYTLLKTLKMPVGAFLANLLDGVYNMEITPLFQGFGASLRIFNDGNSGDQLIEYPQELEDNVWLWGAYTKEDKKYSMPIDSVAILTTDGENPESAFSKMNDVYGRFFMNTKFCRGDFNDPDSHYLPIKRYHEFKKLKFF